MVPLHEIAVFKYWEALKNEAICKNVVKTKIQKIIIA
jgi:hypothetical protein